jgi:N6-adenosine-specific RNA methylase IME4
VGLPFHPLANLFPLIDGAEFAALVASIRANGLRDPIVVHDGMIIDGRNRQRACEAAEVDCVYQPLASDADPLQFVLDKNLHRRHLNESQRAYVAAKLANLKDGQTKAGAQICAATSQEDAAERLHVSRRSVQHAAVVRDKAEAEIQREVERGTLSVSAAAQAAQFAPEQQRKIATEASAGRANAARTVIKQQAREEREQTLAAKQVALPQQKFGVVYADPEWRFEPWSRETGLDRAADNHYPTSEMDLLSARDVASISADDCVLFLWATVPMLPQALALMRIWGFAYKSHCTWNKRRRSIDPNYNGTAPALGTGYWFRNAHELLLLGTKGKIPAPAPGKQWSSVVEAMIEQHSAKPECFLRLIEDYFPTLPKIELNRRGPARKGWSAWGNEAEGDAPSVPVASPEPAPSAARDGAGSLAPWEAE